MSMPISTSIKKSMSNLEVNTNKKANNNITKSLLK